MAGSSGAVQVSLPPSHAIVFASNSSLENDQESYLHRAASYNSMTEDIETGPGSPGMKRVFSEVSLEGNGDSLSQENISAGKEILRRVSRRSPGKSKSSRHSLTGGKPKETDTLEIQEGNTLKERSSNVVIRSSQDEYAQDPLPEIIARPAKARSVSGKVANLVRKPWISSSRSPSPAPTELRPRASRSREQSPSPETRRSFPNSSLLKDEVDDDNASEADTLHTPRKKTVLSKKPRRPLSAFVPRSRSVDPPSSPSTLSLRSKMSIEQLASQNVSTPMLPPLPKPTAASFASSFEPPRKKDELWTVFRGLEADYQKFQSKSSNLKVNVIRSSLLPFLARFASHPSILNLRPEDLDRRVNILNKWWTGLLEQLNGKHHQAISGTDRPVYLEAIAGIMRRKEWQIPFPSAPSSIEHRPTDGSKSSLESASSDFLAESIHHNVRNMFTQNLLSQMSFVVDRMSMRHAPASLVAFCGKACAYAFYFCPGVADMLVRLWNTPPDVFRRVLADSSVYRGLEGRSTAQQLAANFPPAVKSLVFSSHAALVRYLRQAPNTPLSVAQIQWHGPWLSRWCGRDTDLFFVFVKYFHVLLCDFMPHDTPKANRVFGPGVLSVHGQLLVVLEDTLYRQSASHMPESPFATSSVTFDDFMEGPDATASALPLGAANCHRSMAENRLIILLRDFLSESSQESLEARRVYATSFVSILKTAARKTSLFDHNACFLLCDFVEEALPIINRYCEKSQDDIFDWPFWMDVCKQMTRSENSLTEVRVLAFVFRIWKIWTSDPDRHRDLCMQFLLHEDYFYRYFSHWSPMVRAYFHRLLCWRVARLQTEPLAVESEICETLLDRLEQVWAYYLSFQSNAAKEFKAPLSSAPCSPAPGRRILIIRSDNTPSPAHLFVSFDRMIPPNSPYNGGTWSQGALKLDPNGLPPESQPAQKRKWNILKTVFGSTTNPKPGEVTPPGSSSDETEKNPMDGLTLGGDLTPTSSYSSHDSGSQFTDDSLGSRRPQTPHQPYSFKFSLEWHDRQWNWPSKNKRLYTPRLPMNTQLHVQHRQSQALAGSETDDMISPNDESSADDIKGNPRDTDASTASTADSYATTKMSVDEMIDGSAGPHQGHVPRNERLVASKYAGRALAEWSQVVSECDSFFERRRDEGVPTDGLVETPTLGIDGFRK